MNYRLKISPCPNDTFAFYPLLHGKVDCESICFDVQFEDIETLNNALLSGSGDIIKASIAIAPKVLSDYQLLDAGAALGCGNGPIVVKSGNIAKPLDSAPKRVALPGINTTATLLFNRYFKGYTPIYVRFNEIAQMVKRGEVEMGVLIHEGRFTYQDLGLEKVADLGEMWELESAMPLPLGGIFARKNIDYKQIERIISRSVKWAMENPLEPLEFVRKYASELSQSVMKSHIDYFVNSHTLTLGAKGRAAINSLCNCIVIDEKER